MLIRYSAITKPQDWLETIAHQFKVNVINNEIVLPNKIGEGLIRQYYPFDWLTVSYLKFKVNEPLEMIRTGVSNTPLVPIVFYLSESLQSVDNTQYKVGNHTTNGIFMPSPIVNTKLNLNPNKWNTCVTLTFNKEQITNDLLEKDTYLYKLLTTEDSFYIFESFTIELLALIHEIANEISSEKMVKLHFHSLLMQILDLFFKQLNKRDCNKNKTKIHPKDVEKLFKIRKLILDDVSSLPNIKILAENSGMSLSKLQKGFKQIFGKSITQFALSHKMEEARKMLSTEKYSISDVGYSLGYTNLSHFSESFRKHFNVNPSVFLNSLK